MRSCLTIIVLTAGLYSGSFAAFSQNSRSVVADSLGGAFCARVDDPSAIFINPAGISQLKSTEFSLMYGVPYYGLPGISLQQGYAAAAIPLGKRFTLGFGGSVFDTAGNLTEQEGIVGLAWLYNSVSVGVNATYLYHSYNVGDDALAMADPVFANGTAKGAIGVDAGVLYQPIKYIALGASVRHANSPDVGLLSKDPVPVEYRAGTDAKYNNTSLLFDVLLRDAGADIADGQQLSWHCGVEQAFGPIEEKTTTKIRRYSKTLRNYLDSNSEYMYAQGPIQHKFAVRLGANNTQLTAGFACTVAQIRFDYALALVTTDLKDNNGSHRVSLSYRFKRIP
jgi:hypothetical protein